MNDPTLIADLIRAGVDPELVGRVVNAMLSVTIPQNSAEFRTDISAERRREKDRERHRLRKNSAETPQIPQNSAEFPNSPLTKEDSKKVSKRKGERISAEWKPSTEDQSFALSKGMTLDRISTEVEKFRNYWIAKSGSSAVKLDWSATWRNWILSSLDRVPGIPTGPPPTNDRPAYLTPPPGMKSREQILEERRQIQHGETPGSGVRSDAGVGKNGADRSPQLPLPSGETLRRTEQAARGPAPDD